MSKEKESVHSVELPRYDLRTWIKAFILGLFIGLAVIIPGVSGSTVAIMFGLYAALLYAIGNILEDFRRCVKFLIPIGIGVVIGFGAGFLLIQLLLEKYIFVVVCLFVGLMIGASPALLREIKGERASLIRILLMIIGILIPLAIGASGAITFLLDPTVSEEGASQAFTSFPWYRFVLYVPLGIIVSATQLIPGLSATAIMMSFGQFKPIMDSVHLDYILENPAFIGLMVCLGGGFVIGLIIVSKLFSKIIAWRRAATFYFVVGLSFGSIGSMFFNSDMAEVYYSWGNGGFSAVELIIGIVLLAIGLIGSLLLTKYELIHDSNKNDDIKGEKNDEI
jgi:putative membrane protein